jgi:hypothetical protein
MGFVSGDVTDLIVSHKNDHGPSHRRYRALQRYRRLKISFCEIFGVVRFSTFATISTRSGHLPAAQKPAWKRFRLGLDGPVDNVVLWQLMLAS